MTELRDLPAIRKLAEEQAQDLHYVHFGRFTDGERLRQYIEAHLALLCDLTRPASRDAVARLVAPRFGCEPHELAAILEDAQALAETWDARGWINPPDGRDPAEALRLIALHVLGAP